MVFRDSGVQVEARPSYIAQGTGFLEHEHEARPRLDPAGSVSMSDILSKRRCKQWDLELNESPAPLRLCSNQTWRVDSKDPIWPLLAVPDRKT